jgi:hypothetical protein
VNFSSIIGSMSRVPKKDGTLNVWQGWSDQSPFQGAGRSFACKIAHGQMLSFRLRAEAKSAFGHETADGKDARLGMASSDPQVPRGAGRIGFRSLTVGFPFLLPVRTDGPWFRHFLGLLHTNES